MSSPYDTFPEKSVWIDQLRRTVICLRIWNGEPKKIDLLLLGGEKTIEFKTVHWPAIDGVINTRALQRCRDFDK
jgi:hypothetical protein